MVQNKTLYPRSLRECISQDENEVVVFGVDILSQPHYRREFLSADPLAASKCSRALPIAREEDIVVLTGALYQPYYRWLRSLGLGPKRVVEYNQQESSSPLSEIICKDPQPLQIAIAETGRRPVYVPFYSSMQEMEVAELLGAELFGCPEDVILKYFNKQSFKEVCQELSIETVGGGLAHVKSADVMNTRELGEMVDALLHNYPRLILRGTAGSAGSSIYVVDSENVEEVHQQILDNHETDLLVEPFLSVVVSPNDQFVIGRDGTVSHLGVSIQLFEELRHTGNLRGQYLAERTERYIEEMSLRIVENMAEHGYRGVLGIDYIVSTDGTFPVENNARLNGSTFTLEIVSVLEKRHKARLPCWKFFRAYTEPCSFEELTERLMSILYTGETAMNVVFPFDCDNLEETGRFTPVILAEDMYHIEFLERALHQLGIKAM